MKLKTYVHVIVVNLKKILVKICARTYAHRAKMCAHAMKFAFLLFSQSVSLTQYVVLFVHLPACLPVPVSLLSKRPSSFCLIHFVGTSGAAGGQKRTFNRRRPLMEDDL